jgi:hypothetical protein
VSFLSLTALSAQAGGIGDLFGAFAGRIDTYGSGRQGQEKQMEAMLTKVSEYMNKRMPELISADTRLDRVSAEPGPHFSYHYTFLSSNAADIDKAHFMADLRAKLKVSVCQKAEVRNFLNHGVTVVYNYRAKDEAPIGSAEFAPNSCDDIAQIQ